MFFEDLFVYMARRRRTIEGIWVSRAEQILPVLTRVPSRFSRSVTVSDMNKMKHLSYSLRLPSPRLTVFL